MTSNFQKLLRLSLVATAGTALITSAAAGDVALVESLTTNTSGIGYMEYVKPGQVVRLGARDTLVLTYMTSCVQETIRGGTVTIGTELSEVQSGEVVRVKRECGKGKMVLTGAQTAIGGRSFRGAPH
jgi:hypothetical protein